jgi:predicted TIM-barrel fold metal-dependent hydrolase
MERRTTRRGLLRAASSAAAAGLAATLSEGAEAQGRRKVKIIDAHSHVWTPDTTAYPLAAGFKRENMQPPSFTPEQFFGHAKPEGVEQVVLIQMSFYGFDNSYMLDSMKKHPGKCGAVAVVDWEGARPDDDMARMAKHGVRGFRVYPRNVPFEHWMETPGFERMFKHAADHRLSLCPLIDPRALPSLSRMCEKHPKTSIVIDHLCRIGADGKIADTDVDALAGMARFPEVRVKVSAFYALGKKAPPHDDLEPMIRRMHQAFGARRLMWASDCPFAVVSEKYRDAVSLVRDGCSWLSKENREWLLHRTATHVFF